MEGFPCRLCWEGTICLARPPPGASATSLALKGGLKVLRFFSHFLIIYFSYLTKWMAGRSKGSSTNVNCLFILKIQKSHSTGRLAWWHNRITDTCLEENCMMKENRDTLDFYIKLLNGIHQELNFLWSPLSCINIQISATWVVRSLLYSFFPDSAAKCCDSKIASSSVISCKCNCGMHVH